MALAFDASSASGGTNDFSWTHTPVGTPRGVVVFVTDYLGTTDTVTGVTYGGTAMTEVALSPLLKVAGDEDAVLHCFFLGSSIPTGAQTVAVDLAGAGTAKRAWAITVTAAADTEVDDTSTMDVDFTTTPTVTLTTSVETFVAGLCVSGVNFPTSIAEGTGYTLVEEFDHGNQISSVERATTNPSAGSVDVTWTTTNDDNAAFAIAVREASAAAPTPKKLATLGVG